MTRTLHKITQKFVEKVLRKTAPDGLFSDGGNLYLRTQRQCTTASWLYCRTVHGKKVQYNIGSVAQMGDWAGSPEIGRRATASLAMARQKAAEYRHNQAAGKPVKAKIEHALPSLDEVVTYYCQTKSLDRKKTNSYLSTFEPIYRQMGPVFAKEMGVAYREGLKKAKKSENTIGTYLRQMKGLFTVYMVDHNVPDMVNPFDGVVFKKNVSGRWPPLSA